MKRLTKSHLVSLINQLINYYAAFLSFFNKTNVTQAARPKPMTTSAMMTPVIHSVFGAPF